MACYPVLCGRGMTHAPVAAAGPAAKLSLENIDTLDNTANNAADFRNRFMASPR